MLSHVSCSSRNICSKIIRKPFHYPPTSAIVTYRYSSSRETDSILRFLRTAVNSSLDTTPAKAAGTALLVLRRSNL